MANRTNHKRRFDREEALALYSQGWSLTQLAKKYNVTTSGMGDAFLKMGISSMKKARPVLNEVTLAYFAGLFDGEGHVSIVKAAIPKNGNPRYWLQVGISSTSREYIEYMRATFDCGHISKTGTKTEHKLDCWAWRCTTNDALFFLQGIEPFAIGKKEAIRLGIEFQLHTKGADSWEWCDGIKKRVGEINRTT